MPLYGYSAAQDLSVEPITMNTWIFQTKPIIDDDAEHSQHRKEVLREVMPFYGCGDGALEKFELFRELPPELRLKIWEIYIEDNVKSRLLNYCLIMDKEKEKQGRFKRKKKIIPKFKSLRKPIIPPILHICYETRVLGLKIYKLALPVLSKICPQFGYIPFHPKLDTLTIQIPFVSKLVRQWILHDLTTGTNYCRPPVDLCGEPAGREVLITAFAWYKGRSTNKCTPWKRNKGIVMGFKMGTMGVDMTFQNEIKAWESGYDTYCSITCTRLTQDWYAPWLSLMQALQEPMRYNTLSDKAYAGYQWYH